MLFLSIVFQIAVDWSREILLDVLGLRVEEFLGKLFDRNKSRRKAKRRTPRRGRNGQRR
jgi:hypothetical protein